MSRRALFLLRLPDSDFASPTAQLSEVNRASRSIHRNKQTNKDLDWLERQPLGVTLTNAQRVALLDDAIRHDAGFLASHGTRVTREDRFYASLSVSFVFRLMLMRPVGHVASVAAVRSIV